MTATGSQCDAGFYCSGGSPESAPVNQTWGDECPAGERFTQLETVKEWSYTRINNLHWLLDQFVMLFLELFMKKLIKISITDNLKYYAVTEFYFEVQNIF